MDCVLFGEKGNGVYGSELRLRESVEDYDQVY